MLSNCKHCRFGRKRKNKCLIFKFLSDIIHGDAPYFISKGVTYMKEPLTDKERAILEFVISATRLNGYPPSVRDICAETGIKSTSTVFSYIKRLEEKGYLEKEDGKSRSIRTKADPAERNSIRVPLLGDVAAGLPILAAEDLSGEEYIDFTPSGGSASSFGGRLFALRIRGTSMVEAGILDGDIVVVERTPVADDGDIVVALIGDEATVKTFYREKDRFRLQPENRTMEPIYTTELSVLGKVVADIRYYS